MSDSHQFRIAMPPVVSASLLPVVPAPLLPVVEELLIGTVDTVASRHLNLSSRTYSRRVTELLDHLGVTTRFQAGVQIGRVLQPVRVQHRPAYLMER